MRFDTPIYFQYIQTGEYNESTGNYDDDTLIETQQMAAVMDTSTENMKLIYGDIRQGSLTLTIQNHYDETFNYIRVGQKRYHVDRSRRLHTKQTYIVSEVQ